jgi:hypothetical protein
MEDKKSLRRYADLTVVTGTYEKDGKTKNRYAKVGTLLATPHFSHMAIKLDVLPMSGEGWLNVFPIERQEGETPKGTTIEDISDEVVDLSTITPTARLANPERGLFFLLWVCSCGRERASNLLSREGIEEIKKQYKQRVTDSAHLQDDLESVERV